MPEAYIRPRSLEEALQALAANPEARPMGRGFFLLGSQKYRGPVIDLQDLGLDTLRREGNEWVLGATLPLQALLEHPDVPETWQALVRRAAPYPQRAQMTAAGSLVAADGRSLWAAALLALDARLTLMKQGEPTQTVHVGDWLPLRAEWRGWLMTEIRISQVPQLAWEAVARSPADRPLLLAAVAGWPRGRTRVVVGGWGDAPRLALDGPTAHGAVVAAQNAAYDAQDHLASAEYRREVAQVLVRRCLQRLNLVDPNDLKG